MSLRTELQEFVDKYAEVKEDGKITPEEGHQLARELFDVVREVLAVDTSAESKRELAAEIKTAIDLVVARQLASRPIIRSIVSAFVDKSAKEIVEAVGGYIGTADEFWRDKVDPILARWESSIHSLRMVAS